MSIGKPKITAPTQAPAPAAQGADALNLGTDETNPALRQGGALGRLKLRVGGPAGTPTSNGM